MTDRELLEQMKQDPNAAMAELACRYTPLTATIAGRILPGHHADIEEVAADALVGV